MSEVWESFAGVHFVRYLEVNGSGAWKARGKEY